MKLLTVLKYSINFIFFSFILTELLVHVLSIYNGQYASDIYFWWTITYILIHEIIILMVLYYLRKFVLNADKGTPLDKSTRKYLKLSGIFCLIYGFLDSYKLIIVFEFYSTTGEYNNPFFVENIWACSSLFFTIFIGLFFIYLSQVLASSDEIRQENKLTI